MTTWKILFLWILPCYRAGDDGMFECGSHGRFEYCIDGIPGCVIGCHCHPGYYFDTESKICEPNTKLTQNYRRHSVPEPNRVQNPILFSDNPPTETLPILTTHNIIEQHVNDITKNADGLSDWLYNQFFKTIENQVINNTNKDQLTRRSGRGSLAKHNKLKRRARRKGNKRKKKKKGMHEKLLGIAEDDSLFQSSESSDADSTSSDLSQSYSSFESDSGEDHGHKKILLINKKPRPPLPSFIFLPNMNTPYYPPIGLQPPPIMPMYPMVPVPPMMPAPPLLPYPGQVPECDENTTTATTKSPATSTTIATTSTEEKSMNTDSATTTTQLETFTTKEPALRSHYRGRKRKKLKSLENVPDENEEPQLDFYEPNHDGRQKLIKLLQQRMNNPRINDSLFKRHKKPFDNYSNQLISPERLIENDLMNEIVPDNENTSPPNLEENVDFKYLSQLIHHVNENQTQDVPIHMYNPLVYPKMNQQLKGPKKSYRDFNVPLESSRRINQYINTSRNSATDDSFYSKLGRQIATLIRTIDADKERQFNIEIEKVQQKPNEHPYFNENGPRTFWERFVRSPLKFFHSFQTRFDDLKNSNELLFNIENKVETVASTAPTLSLRELENMINVMETARTQLQSKKIKNTQPSSKMLNVNLWPQEIKQNNKKIIRPNQFDLKRRNGLNYSNIVRPGKLNTYSKKQNQYPFNNRTNLHQVNDISIKHGLHEQPTIRNITKMYSQPMYKLQDQRTLHSSEKHRHTMKPTILNYKNIKKYFFDQNNQYSFQNDNLPLQYSPASRASHLRINPLVSSPYFHHEINHVDYIT